MRIYIVSDVFPPEPVTSAAVAGDIADELGRRGHDVTAFVPYPNRPAGRLLAHHRRAWHEVEQRGSLRIVRSWHTISRRSTVTSRFAENLSFGLTSTRRLLRAPRPDAVYMNTWPLFAQYLNARALHHRSVPVACVVKDLYPETLGDGFGVRPGSRLHRWLVTVDRQVYRHCALVAALNDTTADHLRATRGLAHEKVCVWRDWVDDAGFPATATDAARFRARHGLATDQLLAMYVGSLTRMAGLDLYVEAAQLLRHRPGIRILLVGDGAMRETVIRRIRDRGLTNIQVVHPLAPTDVPMVQAAADVLLMSLAPGAAPTTTPSKLIYYLFSGRPIIGSVAAGSPSHRLIAEAGCGHTVAPGDARELAARLEALADEPGGRSAMGRHARRHALAHFTRSETLPLVCDSLEALGRASARGAASGTPRTAEDAPGGKAASF